MDNVVILWNQDQLDEINLNGEEIAGSKKKNFLGELNDKNLTL